jgi:hypothetical protein
VPRCTLAGAPAAGAHSAYHATGLRVDTEENVQLRVQSRGAEPADRVDTCVSLVEGTNSVRRELGVAEARVRTADPRLYFGGAAE